VVEQDICNLVLSVDVHMDQTCLDDRGVARVVLADQKHPASSPDSTLVGAAGADALEVQTGESFTGPLAGNAEAAGSNAPLRPSMGPPRMPKETITELLRVRDYIGR